MGHRGSPPHPLQMSQQGVGNAATALAAGEQRCSMSQSCHQRSGGKGWPGTVSLSGG